MSDFGAGTCDFHSDFASDFHTEWNDFASDFASDFGGEPRTEKQPPEPPRDRTAGSWYSRRRGHRGTRAAASWQRTAQAASHGAGDNATPQGHKQRPQGKQDGAGIGIAPNIKMPYRRVKIANKAYSRKAAGIHREKKKNPAQREPCGARLFLELCKVKQQENGLQQDIQQDQGRHLLSRQL